MQTTRERESYNDIYNKLVRGGSWILKGEGDHKLDSAGITSHAGITRYCNKCYAFDYSVVKLSMVMLLSIKNTLICTLASMQI